MDTRGNLGKLITVIGNSGVGKTTFVQNLCTNSGFIFAKEQHERRPFQELFSLDHQRYALANQIDYLLFRAEQETEIRKGGVTGVQDGGLDEDFHVFTRLFLQKGFLAESEYDICERTYRFLREVLPPPNLIVWLHAPLSVIAERYAQRDRRLGIAKIEDLKAIEVLLDQWLGDNDLIPVVSIDTASEDRGYSKSIMMVMDEIDRLSN
jgi:deoxyadenosine/deoxycytidine kinase